MGQNLDVTRLQEVWPRPRDYGYSESIPQLHPNFCGFLLLRPGLLDDGVYRNLDEALRRVIGLDEEPL